MSPGWPLTLRTVELPKVPLLLLMALVLGAAPARAIAQETAANGTSRQGSVAGTVYDSLSSRPLPGALVQLVGNGNGGRVLSDTSGANGEFEIADVPPGSYIIGFFHPVLDSLGLGVASTPLEVAGAAPTHVALAIPSGQTVRRLICTPTSGTGASADSTGLLIGFVRDADSGAPLSGASVVVIWRELVIDNGIRNERREIPAKANELGWFALCGLPTDGPITARAELGSDATGFIEISIPPRGLLHRDFNIPRGAAATVVAVTDSARAAAGETVRRGSARLTGSVRDERGRPLSGAQLMVWGSGVTGSTGEDGTFALAELPAGSQSLEVRYVGYAPARVTVDLVSDATRTVAVTLDKRADVLDQVTVYGKRSKRSSDFTGFLQRSKKGFGRFLTRADIEKRHPFQATDIFRMMPGFMVVPDSGFGYTIVSTRGGGISDRCQPNVYVDGMRLYDLGGLDGMVLPNDIAAVEAYAGSAGVPPQYPSDGCGSIVIWTGTDLHVTQN
ncbi:MAG TPA: carboxypeptidase regulatory-like domain-containing protein [Gemmatimonadaceae bacterium]|nr:carboxypeptidase regulatory-like domain-containing protein [Gemmatimonadaceae bacterium]